MKNHEIIIVGAALAAAYLIWKGQQPARTAPAQNGQPAPDNFVDEIFGSNGLPFDNGWRYYENGTSIAPNGDYYHQGALVWKAGA